MQLVLLGAPGAGKGTQGEFLEKEFSLVRIATGDLLRAAMAEGTELGHQAKAYVSRGELVPDELVTELVKDRLQAPDTTQGFILDGFPRNVAQAQSLEDFLSASGRGTVTALYLEVDQEALLKRLTGRRVCPKCKASFHLTNRPPKQEGKCDACGSQLVQRPDDTEQVIRHRLEVYRRETEPVLDFYAARGQLKRVDGNGDLDEIFSRILKVLGAAKR
ncbi:MAG: adenylate kinase [Firmicutes bacterium]|jgi:adenylate kinase|nr:adenylate kinase [Bacillota bacterium]